MSTKIFGSCAAILGLLAGCADQTPKIVTQTVNIPVAVSCIPTSMPPAPDYPDTDAALTAAGVDGPRRYQLVVAGRALRTARLAVVESVLSNCASVGPEK